MCKDKFDLFNSDLSQAIHRFLPQKEVRKHPTDRPWITTKIKKEIQKRNQLLSSKGKCQQHTDFGETKSSVPFVQRNTNITVLKFLMYKK
jgi:hypothetical protein